MWGHMGDYGWGWGGMWLGMLLFWGLLAAAVVVFVRYTMRRDDTSGRESEKSALDTLKERYARGEIGREEFQEKKRDLES